MTGPFRAAANVTWNAEGTMTVLPGECRSGLRLRWDVGPDRPVRRLPPWTA